MAHSTGALLTDLLTDLLGSTVLRAAELELNRPESGPTAARAGAGK